MKVAFLGLGTMGAAMARNVLRGGHDLTLYNRTTARAAPLVQEGARLASSPADAAAGREILILMLSDDAAVDAVAGGPSGLLAGLSPGAVVVDMSTVDRGTALRTCESVEARGAAYVDAPVSGSRQPAVDGTLLIMAGGRAAALARARPVLDCMGRVKHVGPVGHGMAMKLVLATLGAHMVVGLGAGLVMGRKMGLGVPDMLDAIGSGAFASPIFAAKGAKIAARDFAADFRLALLHKDQALVLDTMNEVGAAVPTQAAIVALLEEALAMGLGDLDLCAVVKLFEARARL
ncbi:MAG: NAD(P)-dependent oxidoreductase [Micrococcales bacterium]|nr:NAD(P)-dependent oxidoreductase [Micrococcales bacterium]